MAASWQGQAANGQYPYQPSTGYQQTQPGYQQHPGYNAAAYQQYYAQYYGANQYQQQHAWNQGQYSQQYPQQAWQPGQYSQQYPAQHAAAGATPPIPQSVNQPAQQTAQPTVQTAIQKQSSPESPATPSSNHKGASCYNCGSHDHWAASCPQPSRSSQRTPSSTTTTPGQSKGPVVTRYAVPPHVLAQMKARGVTGSVAVAPAPAFSPPQYPHGTQYSGWQQWQAQTYPYGGTQPKFQQHHPQAPIPTGGQYSITAAYPSPAPAPAQAPTQAPLSAPDTQPQASTTPSITHAEVQSAPATDEQPQVNEQTTDPKEPSPDEDDEDEDLNLLDIPDMPKSYGTSDYVEPKLVAKPVYSVAPEWTSPGFGEVTISPDPNGRTHSDYIKPDNIDSGTNVTRTPAHDADPVFAVIDLDAPATVKLRSGSRDSTKSEFETPYTYESGDTRPTSVDDLDEYPEHYNRRRSRSPPRHRRHSHGNRSPRRNFHHNQKRKKRRDRGRDRDRDRRDQNGQQGKKRKHDDAEDRGAPRTEIKEPQAKKHQPETATTADVQLVQS